MGDTTIETNKCSLQGYKSVNPYFRIDTKFVDGYRKL